MWDFYADYIIELGSEGGLNGGKVIAKGTRNSSYVNKHLNPSFTNNCLVSIKEDNIIIEK